MSQAKSRASWGREPYKTDEELNQLCTDFFSQVVLPAGWQFKGFDKCFDSGICTELHPEGTITSIGAVYMDSRTRGQELKHYKVLFLTFSCRGAICEKYFIDYGKQVYKCVVSNKTAEQLSVFINENYKEI